MWLWLWAVPPWRRGDAGEVTLCLCPSSVRPRLDFMFALVAGWNLFSDSWTSTRALCSWRMVNIVDLWGGKAVENSHFAILTMWLPCGLLGHRLQQYGMWLLLEHLPAAGHQAKRFLQKLRECVLQRWSWFLKYVVLAFTVGDFPCGFPKAPRKALLGVAFTWLSVQQDSLCRVLVTTCVLSLSIWCFGRNARLQLPEQQLLRDHHGAELWKVSTWRDFEDLLGG